MASDAIDLPPIIILKRLDYTKVPAVIQGTKGKKIACGMWHVACGRKGWNNVAIFGFNSI
jgi:hypothetical protein